MSGDSKGAKTRERENGEDDTLIRLTESAFLKNKLSIPLCPLAPGLTLQEVLAGSNMNPNTASMVIVAMYVSLDRFSPGKLPVTFPLQIETTARDGKEGKSDLDTIDLKTSVKAPLTASLCVQLKSLLEPAEAYFVELVAASQVKPLRVRNVTSYFKSCQLDIDGDPLMKHISFMTAAAPKLYDLSTVSNRALKDKWLKYHTTYASSPQLCMKAMKSLEAVDPQICDLFFTAPAVRQVAAAVAAPWDKVLATSISEDTLCKTFWFLTAINQLPEGWYQGMKARDALPTFATERMRAFFVRLVALSANRSSIENAVDISTLISAYRRA